eukprot:11361572-Alexandrium_andersonii.AAC.1
MIHRRIGPIEPPGSDMAKRTKTIARTLGGPSQGPSAPTLNEERGLTPAEGGSIQPSYAIPSASTTPNMCTTISACTRAGAGRCRRER